MTPSADTVRVGLSLVVGGVLVLSLVGVLPVQVGYVYSGSMEPSLQPGDGFLLVPANDVAEGDIITFYASNRGEYVSHRVVDVTTDGLVTKGDANPTTDQAAGAPAVDRAAVVGEVVAVDGRPVAISGLATVARATGQFGDVRAPLLVILGVFLVETLLARRTSKRSRSAPWATLRATLGDERARETLAFAIAFGICFGIVATTAFPVDRTFIVSEAGYDSGTLVPIGQAATRTVQLPPSSSWFVQVISCQGGSVTNDGGTATLRIPAQSSPGPHPVRLVVGDYPRTLPAGVIEHLHGVDPLLAAGATTSVPFGILYALALGSRELATRRRRQRTAQFEWVEL